MEPVHLDSPPILEALVDFRVVLPADIDLPQLATFQEAIRSGYPERQDRLVWTGELTLAPGVKVTGSEPLIRGYLFKSNDLPHVVQASLDGYTFSRIRPYDSWEQMRKEAVALWKHYIAIAKPLKVTRIALRYINRIELPSNVQHISDYFLTYPVLAPKIPQLMSELYMRMVLPDQGSRQAIVTISTDPTVLDKVVIIFDVDVFQAGDFEIDNDTIWDAVDKLRALKNRIFFGSLTDAVLKGYTK